jgi:predicted DNA-binding protein (UPF0251 family)
MAELANAVRKIPYWPPANPMADSRFTRYRGDGWQVLLDAPGNALRTCIYLTAKLKASDCGLATRISVGLGVVNSLGTNDLSDASGDAFIISGYGLDNMPRSRRFAIAGNKDLGKWHTAIYDQADWQSSRWSREQAEAVALALDPANHRQEEMAKRLGISRQALQARLSSAGLHALTAAFDAFESADNPNEDFQ